MNRLFEQNKRTLNAIKGAVFYFRIQNDYIAYQRSNSVMALLETMAAILAEENRVSELEQLLPLLQQALDALDCQNATLLADIYEEGIYPLLCNLQADIFATEENIDVDYWGNNRKILRSNNKDLYSKILSVRENISNDYSLSFAKTGEPVLHVMTGENDVRINSASDPWEEALLYANQMISDDFSEYLVVGFGMGYHVQAMINNPLCEKLVVLESDLEQMAIATAYRNYSGVFKNEKLTVVYCEKPQDYMEWINKCGDTMKCCIWHPSIKSIRNKNLREKLENYWVELLSAKNMGRMLEKNFKLNVKKQDDEITSIKDKFSGKTMILAAAGPSLDNGLESLREMDRDNTVLVCVGKVAGKLIQSGVHPDYIVMIDAKAGTKRWIKGIEDCGIPLLYLSTVASAVVDGYKSKRYIAFQEDFSYAEEYAGKNGYPLYQTGGSVSTFALDVGIRLGCKKIVCIGLDLGYPSDSTHAAGVGPKLAETKSLRKVEGVGGGKISTSKTLDIYRDWIERRIKDEKGIEFINSSNGARIHGMKEMAIGAQIPLRENKKKHNFTKRVMCVLGNELHSGIEKFVGQFDTDEYEIHLFDNIYVSPVLPSDILGELENIIIDSNRDVPCIFMCDIPELFELVYRIYHQIFENFIYIKNNKNVGYDFGASTFYEEILKTGIMPDERLYKSVYCNEKCHIKSGIKTVVYNGSFNDKGIDNKTYQKYYILGNKRHILEPVTGDKISINIDTSVGDGGNIFYYPFLHEQINKIRAWVSAGEYVKYCGDIYDIYKMVDEQKDKLGHFQYNMFMIALEEMLFEFDISQALFKILSLTFLIKMTHSTRLFNLFMQMLIDMEGVLTGENYYYWTGQFRRWHFENKDLRGNSDLEAKIYQLAYDSYERELEDFLAPIPKEERNSEFFVVLTVQFLIDSHAPTRTALERIYTLGKLMNKQVYVINTREQHTNKGGIYSYETNIPSLIENYNTRKMKYGDYIFDFYQCPCEMPDVAEMKKLLIRIRELKPYAIMTIGSGSLFSDLCANMIPVMCVPFVFSTIPKKNNQFTIVGRHIKDDEKEQLKKKGYDLDRIVESTFTFDIKGQNTVLTRNELKLPKDAFILGIVGVRLDSELDSEFFNAMERLEEQHIYIAFAGKFKNYSKWCDKIPWLSEKSTFVGYQDDIMAFMELIDLYVNPKRVGGGFSIIEAFCKGKPGVTINYGDVAAAAGSNFCVADYDEMVQVIKRYVDDKGFYNEMAEKARKRADEMTDSKAALEKILNEVERRKAFF